MQPLDGAYQRVKRAGNHLANLKRRNNILCQIKRDAVVIQRNPATFLLPDGRKVNGVLGSASFSIEPTPQIFSILIGEVIYNLRAALDYLVYELARIDSGNIVNGTQFPIEDSENVFRGRRKSFLKGLSDEHIATIESLQPCNGCNWTQLLRDLSNPDKHRYLTIICNPVVISPSPGSTEAIIAGKPVNVKNDVSLRITLRDGTPIIDTLQQLKLKVAQTLDTFKPEFSV